MNAFWSQLAGSHGAQPSSAHVAWEVVVLAVLGTVGIVWFKSLSQQGQGSFFQSWGVRLKKVARATTEIERKTFHLTGLGVPLAYHICTTHAGWTHAHFLNFAWACTGLIWLGDSFRVMIPGAINYFPFSILKGILRDKERGQLSGTCFFSLGCTMSLALYPPAVAITSIVWLVVGDMSAALVGVAFGGEACVVKMGREGKKSLEGSLAMFAACLLCGMGFWWNTRLCDYCVLVGSLVATLVELHEPLALNDNITIPIASGAALQWALGRVEGC